MFFACIGGALSSMLTFFQALVQADLPGLGFAGLLNMLIAPVMKKNAEPNGPPLHKQVRLSLNLLSLVD